MKRVLCVVSLMAAAFGIGYMVRKSYGDSFCCFSKNQEDGSLDEFLHGKEF